MKKIAAFIGSVVLTAAFITAPATFAASVGNTVRIETQKQAISEHQLVMYSDSVIKLVNKERRNRGLVELKMFPKLSKCADIRVNETTAYWSHQRINGKSGLDVFDEQNLNWSNIAENIAKGSPNPESVMSGWMNSTAHRDSILNPNYRYIGVGCANYNGVFYWTQLFMSSFSEYSYAYLPEKHGELNDDGIVDAVDAAMALKDYASISSGHSGTLDQNKRARADMNSDEVVDAVDAAIILGIYADNSSR
ncbi:MAG: hypothetical protein J5723_07905 [Ruminococcus sp.]|nr:hypothetical protein [Ruminococcus sp.]